MSKKKYLKVGVLGLAALGVCVAGAMAGQFASPNQKLALELVNATSGKVQEVSHLSFQLSNGFPKDAKVTLTLSGAKFTNAPADNLAICYNGNAVTNITDGGVDNATVVLTTTSSVPAGQWLVLSNNCTTDGFQITIPGSVSDGDTITISGSVDQTGEQISAGTIFTIKQQTSAVYEKGTSKISYADDLKAFEGGATSSNATLYVKNATLDVNANNGNFTIKITGDSFAGVDDGIWGNSTHNCTLSLNNDKTMLSNDACPMSNVTDTNAKLTINVYGNETLSARKFYTTLKTKADNQAFAREITLLDNALTHEWVLAGTTFYIPFVRHNADQGIYTTIKIQAKKTAGISSYPVYAEVVKSDGTTQQVTVCGGTLNAGDVCTITGDTLTTGAGKEETMATISVNAPEEALGCFVVYNYQGQSRRVPCKVKDGKIVE